MHKARRPAGRAVFVVLAIVAALTIALHVGAAEKPRIQVNSYVIDATVNPQTHQLVAKAQVTFTALDDISIAIFQLHNALRPTRVVDSTGQVLSAERVSQDSTVRVALPNGMTKGQTSTLTFDYEGNISSVDDSPVPGLKLASISDPVSYLLYAGRWFPVTGYGIDRFTANIHVNVPQGYVVVGSGAMESGSSTATISTSVSAASPDKASEAGQGEVPRLARREEQKKKPESRTERGKRKTAKEEKTTPPENPVEAAKGPNYQTFNFVWDKPSFPGTIVIGKFTDTVVHEAGMTAHVYFLPAHQAVAQTYGDTALKEMAYFTTLYGVPMTSKLNLVELPDDTVPTAWAPGLAALASRAISTPVDYRLLADTVAHQWWGVLVSPATNNDWWITEGGSRYSEARYIEFAAGKAGEQEAIKDMSVGALAYDSVPLGQAGTLDVFDPVFQSMVTDKGGMIFHMLRWVLGDEKYDQTIRAFMSQYATKPVSTADLQKTAEQVYGEQLTWFFSQWLDSTGAPEFKNKYTIFRTAKGFRVVGEISQDLDLFRMPVELRIDTDGKTVNQKIEVVGTNSSYSVSTFGRPRKISIDPNDWVLKNSPDLRIRTAIMRGQQLVQQGNLAESLREFQKALDINRNSSLAHYRIAEVFYLQRNYQAAANAYRDALNGDGDPKWTEVWSHIQLGKIFDLTGQRERAVNEYRQALQTNDNTQGALDAARQYLQKPYQLTNGN